MLEAIYLQKYLERIMEAVEADMLLYYEYVLEKALAEVSEQIIELGV